MLLNTITRTVNETVRDVSENPNLENSIIQKEFRNMNFLQAKLQKQYYMNKICDYLGLDRQNLRLKLLRLLGLLWVELDQILLIHGQ